MPEAAIQAENEMVTDRLPTDEELLEMVRQDVAGAQKELAVRYMHWKDSELIVYSKQGDTEQNIAFLALYLRYVKRVINFHYWRSYRNMMDAEDATSGTFNKAFKAFGRFIDTGRPFAAWLFRIARNHQANIIRDRENPIRSPEISEADLGRADTSPESDSEYERQPSERGAFLYQYQNPAQIIEQDEMHTQLLAAVSCLEPDHQNVIILKFVHGMSNKEIGDIIGRSEGAIKSLYFRILGKLKKILEEKGYNSYDQIALTC